MTQLTLNEIVEVESLVAQGLVTARKHPGLDLWILNYSPTAQYRNDWTPILMRCRGMIVDTDYNIVNASFPKFFNLFEKMSIEDLPDESPKIYQKIDGFLGILYNSGGQPAIATRGTFNSSMAQWATRWIRNTGLIINDFDPAMTYIFEIVEPKLCREQGLLVDYGDRTECILLAVRSDTGEEIDHIEEAKKLGLPFAKEFTGSLDDAIAEMPTMKGTENEGFVVSYSNGLRIKLKCDSYRQLNQLLRGLSPKRILSVLIESGYEGLEELIDGIPDESYNNLKDIVAKIEAEQQHLIDQSRIVYDMAKNLPTRQEQASVISSSPHRAVAFAMLNDGDYRRVALRQVRKHLLDIV